MGLINYIDIDWPDLFKPILTAKTGFFNRIRVNREIIPIIFVPGIMGSRLKNKGTGENVWDPDRDIMIMLRKYGGFWNTPAQRKKMLIGKTFNPNHLDVNENDTKHNEKVNTFLDPWRADRGWGGVFWGSYGNFLQKLQHQKWEKPEKSDNANDKNNHIKELIGKCFEFPVHAFGYNWTDTNFNAGVNLAKQIDKIIAGYKKKGRLCKHVILVSHSMGGLVCRSACSDKIGKAKSNVLGVIHGVQPATGATAAYWRMKAGWERTGGAKSTVSAWVLGTNGEEVTCILGNAPGGLELLPTRDYKNNKGESGWLRVPDREGRIHSFPRNGNPYDEIYKIESNVFWRLINPDWLNPQDKKSKPVKPTEQTMTPWDGYIECINKAEIFHKKLETDCHKNTFQFYAANLNTVDKIAYSREKLSFVERQYVTPSEFGFGEVIETTEPDKISSSRGNCVMYVDNDDQELKSPQPQPNTTYTLSMSPIKDYHGGGDGTVPTSSGNALKKVLYSYQLGKVEHQDAYGNEDAITYVFKSIRNLALKRIKEGEVESAR